MEIERFYLACLAHASYLIHSDGEAAVIDPQRDIGIYIEAAQKLGARIRWILETHLHADFVSGHVELANNTGAVIGLGAGSGALFAHRSLADGDVLPLGKGSLRILATPGHTLESICIAPIDPARSPEPFAVITGDTLFIGDVGRPDLSGQHTPQQLAGMLFESLHKRLLTLPDSTLVYPAHGAGSLCGRQMSSEATSTIGRERATNYALQAKTREEFVDLLTSDLPPRPAYFAQEAQRNRLGAAAIADVNHDRELSPEDAESAMAKGAVLLDTRPVMQFACAHIPGSVHIGLSGQFASWAARLLGIDTHLVIVAEDDAAATESRLRLTRVGIDYVDGHLSGGFANWIMSGRDVAFIPQISVQELAAWRAERPDEVSLIDVREPGEFSSGHMEGAINFPLGQLADRMGELPRAGMLFVHCKGGYRSSAATSLLKRTGFDAVNIIGGFDAWQTAFPASR